MYVKKIDLLIFGFLTQTRKAQTEREGGLRFGQSRAGKLQRQSRHLVLPPGAIELHHIWAVQLP